MPSHVIVRKDSLLVLFHACSMASTLPPLPPYWPKIGGDPVTVDTNERLFNIFSRS